MILTDNETVLVYCPPACANGCIRLPETITCIERHVFENCTQLTAVEFPKGLRKIGDTTVQPDNAQTRGKVAKIGYLLQVTEVE